MQTTCLSPRNGASKHYYTSHAHLLPRVTCFPDLLNISVSKVPALALMQLKPSCEVPPWHPPSQQIPPHDKSCPRQSHYTVQRMLFQYISARASSLVKPPLNPPSHPPSNTHRVTKLNLSSPAWARDTNSSASQAVTTRALVLPEATVLLQKGWINPKTMCWMPRVIMVKTSTQWCIGDEIRRSII